MPKNLLFRPLDSVWFKSIESNDKYIMLCNRKIGFNKNSVAFNVIIGSNRNRITTSDKILIESWVFRKLYWFWIGFNENSIESWILTRVYWF